MKKIRLMLVFTFIMSLVYGLEFDSFLSITEDSRSVTSQDSVLYLATPYGISIYDYTNQSLDFVDVFNIVETGYIEYNRVVFTEH